MRSQRRPRPAEPTAGAPATKTDSYIILIGRGRPHQILLAAVQVLVGLRVLSHPTNLLPGAPGAAGAITWALVMVVGGGASLAGVAGAVQTAAGVTTLHSIRRWLRIEQVGQLIAAAPLTFYSVASFSVRGPGTILGPFIWLAWAGSNLWRGRQIQSDLLRLRG